MEGAVDSAALFVRGDACQLAITRGTGIYRNARGDGTIQLIPNVPNDTDANFVLNVLTRQRERTRFDLRGRPQVSCFVGVR